MVSLAAEQARALKRRSWCSAASIRLRHLRRAAGNYRGEDPADFGAALDEQNTAELVIRHALAQLLGAGIEARGRVIAGESAETIVAQGAPRWTRR